VDILALLDDTISKIDAGSFANQYEFEENIANITVHAYDGHFEFLGMTFIGALRWTRGWGSQAALISVSTDGSALTQIYLKSKSCTKSFQSAYWTYVGELAALNASGHYTASPISQINGIDVLDFLRQESLH